MRERKKEEQREVQAMKDNIECYPIFGIITTFESNGYQTKHQL